jgi:hypothetical protein
MLLEEDNDLATVVDREGCHRGSSSAHAAVMEDALNRSARRICVSSSHHFLN